MYCEQYLNFFLFLCEFLLQIIVVLPERLHSALRNLQLLLRQSRNQLLLGLKSGLQLIDDPANVQTRSNVAYCFLVSIFRKPSEAMMMMSDNSGMFPPLCFYFLVSKMDHLGPFPMTATWSASVLQSITVWSLDAHSQGHVNLSQLLTLISLIQAKRLYYFLFI